VTDKTLGDQELGLLQWVADRGPVSVGEASEEYGEPRGLARTTVQTMLERLRAKGQLERARDGGVFRYRSPLAGGEVLRRAVGSFVERALGGSVAPVVAYLAEREEVSPEELAKLELLVERLQGRREEDPS
jgi:predicted transcriptional regulator